MTDDRMDPVTELVDFLLARFAEDELDAPDVHELDCDLVRNGPVDPGFGWTCSCDRPARVLAKCKADRMIVELHKSWPVLVETKPELSRPDSVNDMTFRLTQQIAWLTQEEYRKRFGTEPPTAPVLRALALPYADHPDYREEWKP